MSVIQVEDLVSYQLRAGYLNEVADGVGERLFTLNESFLNTAPFKAAGWRSNPALIKRTHSPPIPTAIASEYFQAPRAAGLPLEDEGEEGSIFAGGGPDAMGLGLATKRRRRREQMEEDDSSDLSDESDDEPDQRAAQQIKFAKMPLRNRSGSSPLQSSNLRQTTTMSSPRAAATATARRGSQSALETVKERARRDTVTSSEVSSENEFDASGFHRHREAARIAAARAAKMSGKPLNNTDPAVGVKRQESELLEEELEDDDSDASDMSSAFVESLDSASILNAVKHPMNPSPREQVVGTPPREFARRLTIRKSAMPAPLHLPVGDLPPPRPMSTIRPISMMQPKSLLSAALKAKKTKPALPFDSFASLSGQGDPNPIMLRIYAPFSTTPSKPFEVLIRRTVHQGEGGDRAVTVAELIGLSLWRYNEEKLEPPIPADKWNVNWWTLRMVEEDGEVDDDFPPLERKKNLTSFTTANNKAGRSRSNSNVYDIFALVQASQSEFAENKTVTPEFEQEEVGEESEDITPKNTPRPDTGAMAPAQPRENPVLNTTYRANTSLFADMPQPAQPASIQNTARGEKKLLRIHIHSADVAPGQMITLDVTTETWLADILDTACRKRQLDKANHVLKLPNSGTVVLLDRRVASLGNITDLDLYRRRFATDGPLALTGSPSSSSPKPLLFADNSSWSKSKKTKIMGTHPLAKEVLKQDELSVSSNYKKYTVWRKQPMRLLSERLFAIDGEYVHIMPASGGKMVEVDGKTTTVHFSNVVGCKVSRKHPTNFKLVVYKATESKRYDFVTSSADNATEIVQELKKGISPYRDV
ncbi:stress-activated map kinase interacting protein 1-domain-containing protein [Bombardia bombarda]|uniref:Stress-activated map kinase interacting protein 1-domain-containing protein n=1 Tax=Bombardia bombarda TaxID=252184 RepID=A0AA39XBR9_9PEZI|nr:stress-activated map kinase interacting protein 1-domain-containing protein [Bombardia bombarda]